MCSFRWDTHVYSSRDTVYLVSLPYVPDSKACHCNTYYSDPLVLDELHTVKSEPQSVPVYEVGTDWYSAYSHLRSCLFRVAEYRVWYRALHEEPQIVRSSVPYSYPVSDDVVRLTVLLVVHHDRLVYLSSALPQESETLHSKLQTHASLAWDCEAWNRWLWLNLGHQRYSWGSKQYLRYL